VASKAPSEFILHVSFETREDGGLRATCADVPNFLLSHSDPELVRKDVEPALEQILSSMFGVPMEVKHLPELSEALEDQVPMPPYIRGAQSYVGRVFAH
jgi:hypothetical protein